MKPEDYKIGTNVIYRLFSKVGSLYEGQILSYSNSKKYVNIKIKNGSFQWYESKNGSSQWYEIDSIFVVDTVENLKEKYEFLSNYCVDKTNNDYFKEKKKCEKEMQKLSENIDLTSKKTFPFSNDPFISGFTVAKQSEVCDKDDPKMTDEDWEDLTKQLYPDEYYPKNYLENNCMYYLEFFQNDRWKLYLRQTLSVPYDLFGICKEGHPMVLGEGKIDRPDMYSMYTYNSLKRIVDGLNLLTKLNEDLKHCSKMSS
jgi:hypothetical protein